MLGVLLLSRWVLSETVAVQTPTPQYGFPAVQGAHGIISDLVQMASPQCVDKTSISGHLVCQTLWLNLHSEQQI